MAESESKDQAVPTEAAQAAPAQAEPAASAPSSTEAAKKSNKKLFIILGIVGVVLILPAIIFFSLMAAGFAFFNAASDNIKITDGGLGNETVTLTDDEGNETTYSGTDKLSSDFPKNDVPLLDDGDVVSSIKSTNEGKTSWLVAVDTKTSMDDSVAKAKDDYSQNGWSVESEMLAGDGGYFVASNDTYEVMVTFTSTDEGGTELTYSVDQK